MKLSKDESNLLRQANRRLNNMRKRATSDKNVENAVAYAESDINIFTKGSNKFKITKDMNKRQKNAILNSAERLLESPYSTVKGTQTLYRKQKKSFAKNYGVTERQASQMIDLFNKEKNSQIAQAWERIRADVRYESIRPHLKDMIGESIEKISPKKFGMLMRLYIETGLSQELDFASFLSDKDYFEFVKNNTTEVIEELIDTVKGG